MAVVAVKVGNAVALVGVVDYETEGAILARVGFALLKDDVATVAGETCRLKQGQVVSSFNYWPNSAFDSELLTYTAKVCDKQCQVQ